MFWEESPERDSPGQTGGSAPDQADTGRDQAEARVWGARRVSGRQEHRLNLPQGRDQPAAAGGGSQSLCLNDQLSIFISALHLDMDFGSWINILFSFYQLSRRISNGDSHGQFVPSACALSSSRVQAGTGAGGSEPPCKHYCWNDKWTVRTIKKWFGPEQIKGWSYPPVKLIPRDEPL